MLITFSFIENLYGVHTLVLQTDFSNFGADDHKLISQTLEGLEIGILVNNVGMHYSYPQPFNEVRSVLILPPKFSCHTLTHNNKLKIMG